jgi:hypothetical protein
MKKSNRNSILAISCVICVVALIALAVWGTGGLKNIMLSSNSQAAAVALTFSSADNFAVLAGSTITNTGSTTISTDLGLSPGTSVTGFPPGIVSGISHVTDGAALAAKADLVLAYNDAAGQTPTVTYPAPQDLGGLTLTPGVYKDATSFAVTGTLTLDAQNDPTAVWIFQAGSTLTTASNSVIELKNGAQACNVFWQVGSSATLGTDTAFIGSILAMESITLNTRASVNGRVLARNAAVTLDTNAITVPTCASAATLRVIKQVINLSVASSSPSDFSVSVKNSLGDNVFGSPQLGTSTPGTLYSLSAGTYTISEGAHALYDQTFGGDCVPSGSVVITTGEKTCTIINTEILPPEVVTPTVSVRHGGGGSSVIVPLIGILKIPSPLALPAGSGLVTYDYTVWNVGGQNALTDVTVADDKCSPVTLLSGDIDNNGKLDTAERWKYRCSVTLSTTTTNTAVATGYGDNVYHQVAIATAIATVAVGIPVVPPLINIVKVPSRLTPFAFGGGDVTYTYTVTNPGVVAMHDVVVTDDKCVPVSGYSGDANNNKLLDPGESWVYTCRTNVSVSTRNTATAIGKANGFTALGYAFATVLVSVPGLPNTGFPPKGI